MKHTNKAAAPLARRASFQNPLAFPGLRFMADGGDGSAVGAGSAPAGEAGDGQDGDNSTPSTNDAGDATNDGQDADDEQGKPSQADDPKLAAARDEAYQNRVKAREAKEAADATAAEKDALIQQLGKALGLIKDDDKGDGPDAEALTKQIADEQAKATEAARELAVYKAAATNGADPTKLLDSRSFLASIKDVDHGDEKAIGAAIKAAVDANKSFASARAAGASTADTASGPGGGSTPKAEVSLEDALASHYNA
ncbi:hypothetical protein [Brevibacterium aurantiacum]|uniref:Uncharacterized protein n=1 Tax=Brevibacterium aurantiacum TaxID=273384 RepID=A0A556C3C4_BREAU|nr:hypothetical protein [Brevibacterium aurantiacum]TSI11964.1 hypothetical protein FO013_21205 [Brevibacterium aurantiacum]